MSYCLLCDADHQGYHCQANTWSTLKKLRDENESLHVSFNRARYDYEQLTKRMDEYLADYKKLNDASIETHIQLSRLQAENEKLRAAGKFLMNAYEQITRSNCTSQAQIDAKPWETWEYCAMREALNSPEGEAKG